MENKPDKYISERGYTIKKSCLSNEEHNKIKKDLIEVLDNSPPNFPVSGIDLINIGLKEGREVGEKLNKIRDWWIKNDCKPSHSECLSKIKKI